MLKRLLEIKRRKEELRSSINTLEGTNLDDAINEAETLDKEQKEIEERMKKEEPVEKRGIKVTMPFVEKNENLSFGVDSPEYRNAFFKKFAGAALTDVEKRAMTTNSTSAGAAVPTSTLNKILEKIENESIIYNLVTVSHLRGNVVIPLEGTTNDVERLGEGEEATVQNDTLESLTLGAKKYIKLVQLTCELEATSIDALEDYIVRKLSKKLAQAFDYDIINGDGTNGCSGILSGITPIETETANTLTYDDICTLFGSLSAAAKKNAKLIMSTNTLYTKVATIKDDNKRPIFNIETNKVLGREITECDDIPEGTIIFGDFSEYQFNWNKDIELSKSAEAAFTSGDTVFRILALVDGGLADLGAMTALTIATA